MQIYNCCDFDAYDKTKLLYSNIIDKYKRSIKNVEAL